MIRELTRKCFFLSETIRLGILSLIIRYPLTKKPTIMKRFLLFLLSLFTVITGVAATETWVEAMTFVAKAVTPTAVLPEQMYIYGNVNDNNWTENGVQMTKVSDGIFRIDHATIQDNGHGFGNFSFSSETGNWDEINNNRYGAENPNSAAITAADLPATKVLIKSYTDFSIPAGRYNIVVNLIDNTMYIEQMEMPENVYVLGDISRHN